VKDTIAAARLANHCIGNVHHRAPAELIAWLGAAQAQDYASAKWALGLRLPPKATERQVEAAVDQGQILRTHVLRPTWHFVAPRDVDWMIQLTSARVHRGLAHAYRTFQLDPAIRVRAARIMERALKDGGHLTRAELGAHLKRAGLPSRGTALALLTVYAELERVLCSGPFRGKTLTYVLYPARVTTGRRLAGDEAIGELTKRYFRSHGPATTRDFVWWSTLTVRDAKRGLEMNKAARQIIDDVTYWTIGDPPAIPHGRRPTVHVLPIYDEYLVAYRDRIAVPLGLGGAAARLGPALVIDGQIAGTWKTGRHENGMELQVVPARRLMGPERAALEDVADRYGRFLGVATRLSVV